MEDKFPSPKSQVQLVGDSVVPSVKLTVEPETEEVNKAVGSIQDTVTGMQVISEPQELMAVRQTV